MAGWLHGLSKWIHKYVGLLLLVFIVWMSVSGILLNHPALLRELSVPRWMTPPQYRIQDWNRGALRTAVFSQADPNLGFLAGSQGVWRTSNGGHTFTPMDKGFPKSFIDRQTSSLIYDEHRGRLFAGTRGGLFACHIDDAEWTRIALPVHEKRIYKLLRIDDVLLILTSSHLLRWTLVESQGAIEVLDLDAAINPHDRIPLVHAWFELHTGAIWGLGGRLLFDVVGLVMVFLCLSAAYLWYWPWKVQRAIRRRQRVKGRNPIYHWLLKYHLKLGIWLAAIMLVIGGTGFFMRPPLIALLVFGHLPTWMYPAPLPQNPWHDRLRNAAYDPANDRLVIEATDGFWETSEDVSEPLRPIAPPGPVFVMGTSVFEFDRNGDLLLGSFSGLLEVERHRGQITDAITGADASQVSRIRPADIMTAGYFQLPSGEAFVVDHYQGIIPLGAAELAGRFAMPVAMKQGFRLPLWNFLFELHNGRIFRDVLGPWYALIVPLGSLLFVLVCLSGVYDWFFYGGRS